MDTLHSFLDTLHTFLAAHAYVVIALMVLADQTGLPVPAAPFLVAAGALARTGSPNVSALLLIASAASVMGHSSWYFAGRLRGTAMLKVVCRLSFEPEACIRRSQDMFTRFGPLTLLAVRFIPGIDTMAQPLVGVAGMPIGQYLGLTTLGAVVWSGTFLGAGYAFGSAATSQHLYHGIRIIVEVVLAGLIPYAIWKIWQRQRQLNELRLPRMPLEELKGRLDAGEQITIIDLRHALEAKFHPVTIPGARRLNRFEASTYLKTLPADQEVVLFCNCPREAGSVSLAHSLTRGGMLHVRPLAGGLDDWQKHNYPTQPLTKS